MTICAECYKPITSKVVTHVRTGQPVTLWVAADDDDTLDGAACYPGEHEPAHCLNQSDECSGPVELWNPGYGYKSWPRCTFHGEKRLADYEADDLQRYAHSDVRPPWFDPTAIGERWDPDDP